MAVASSSNWRSSALWAKAAVAARTDRKRYRATELLSVADRPVEFHLSRPRGDWVWRADIFYSRLRLIIQGQRKAKVQNSARDGGRCLVFALVLRGVGRASLARPNGLPH